MVQILCAVLLHTYGFTMNYRILYIEVCEAIEASWDATIIHSHPLKADDD
jgi:hypothetical protein